MVEFVLEITAPEEHSSSLHIPDIGENERKIPRRQSRPILALVPGGDTRKIWHRTPKRQW